MPNQNSTAQPGSRSAARIISTDLPGRAPVNAAHFDWVEWHRGYAPKDVADWAAIRKFVRESAAAYFEVEPPASLNSAQASMRAIVELSVLLHGKTKLTRRTVFTLVSLTQLDTHGAALARDKADLQPKSDRAAVLAKADVTVASRNSRLVRIGRVLNPAGGWDPQPRSHPRRVTAPYTAQEEALLDSQIQRGGTFAARQGEAIYLLARSAGLHGRELLARGRDCYVGTHGIQIEVNGRLVPVLARFEGRLRALLATAEPDELVIGGRATHKNAVNEAVARVKLEPGTPALEVGRLRNAWILEHLAGGVDVKVLMRAAGLRSLTPISDIAAFLPERTAADAMEMLRCGGDAR